MQFNDESLWEIYPQQEMSFAGYRTVPRLDIPCSSMMRALLRIFTLYSPFHRPGYPCQSEPGDVHMPFEIVYLSMAFDQLELISGGQAGAVTVS